MALPEEGGVVDERMVVQKDEESEGCGCELFFR